MQVWTVFVYGQSRFAARLGPCPRLCGDAVAHVQQEKPEDFVIATGRQESVRRFIELTALELGWGAMQWEGTGIDEVGRRADNGDVVVKIDPRYFRPAEVETFLGSHQSQREVGLDPNHLGRAGG